MPESPKPAEPKTSLLERWAAAYRNNRRRIGSVLAIVVALFLAYHVINGRNGLTSWQKKRTEDKSLTQQIDQLTAENVRLSQHVDRLKSDPGTIEHEARSRFGYARPNEKIWVQSNSMKPAQPQTH